MKLLNTLSVALLVLFVAPAAFGQSDEGSLVMLETTTAGTVGKCELEVARSVSVCSERGECRTLELGDELAFAVPHGGSFTVSATSTHTEDGVIIGNGVSDRFYANGGTQSLVQTLEANDSCSLSFSYTITVR
ncbi:MAG: hypothetical protein RJA70_2930 [Pseudomonadota bacterium]|jgi:hypothetical protein